MKKDKMIKNTCGAISLMLALLVVPFYAVAGILVEASRYQSALTGLDDAMNTSALSVLSDYDSFYKAGLVCLQWRRMMTRRWIMDIPATKTLRKHSKST